MDHKKLESKIELSDRKVTLHEYFGCPIYDDHQNGKRYMNWFPVSKKAAVEINRSPLESNALVVEIKGTLTVVHVDEKNRYNLKEVILKRVYEKNDILWIREVSLIEMRKQVEKFHMFLTDMIEEGYKK